MAEPIPPPLKIPEVSRFLNRANQLRAFKPAIAYWCEYHAVNQIVGKSLHTTDDDCFDFTKTLLERLEATKTERADDDAVIDNTAGQAYVEQFAQETFDRAERALRANKVTRQTADTFDAAATFFDLAHEWGTPEPETLQKIKFAKWNAARILKAIREGKDPNESNPQPQPREAEPELALDPQDPAVQQITSSAPPQAAYVEEVPDAGEPMRLDATPVVGLPPSPSPLPPPPAAPQDGYFPPAQPAAVAPEPFVPSPLGNSPATLMSGITPSSPPQPSPQIPTNIPQQFPPQNVPQPPPPTTVNPPPPPSNWTHQPPQAPSVAPPVQNLAGSGGSGRLMTDQKSITQAQKHAKWAISALNFDDVPTAVQELRNALATLGAL